METDMDRILRELKYNEEFKTLSVSAKKRARAAFIESMGYIAAPGSAKFLLQVTKETYLIMSSPQKGKINVIASDSPLEFIFQVIHEIGKYCLLDSSTSLSHILAEVTKTVIGPDPTKAFAVSEAILSTVNALTDAGYIEIESELDYMEHGGRRRVNLLPKFKDPLIAALESEPDVSHLFPSLPSLTRLSPWSGLYGGGNTRFSSNNKLIRYKLEVLAPNPSKIKSGPWMESINSLQDVAFKVNTRVLDILLSVKDTLPWVSISYTSNETDRKNNEQTKKQAVIRALNVAERYRNDNQLFLPISLDFRGRVYYGPSLNPQGSDTEKGLIVFSEGIELGKVGIGWLKAHIANSYGYDKVSKAGKELWVDEHIEFIKSVAYQLPSDPHKDGWMEVDSPVVFLAACIDYVAALDSGDPEHYISHIPVALDATCSGFQHISGLSYDEVGGFYVNLTDNNTRQDLYGKVAEVVTSYINDPDYLIPIGSRPLELERKFKERAKQLELNRKIVKKPVMTAPYGGTVSGFGEAIKAALEEEHKAPFRELILLEGEEMIDKKEEHQFLYYLGQLTFNALKSTVPNGFEVMAGLQKIMGSYKNEDSLYWKVEDGFITFMDYIKITTDQITLILGEGRRRSITLKLPSRDKTIKNTRKNVNAIVPNFIHSLDSCLVRMSASALDEKGVGSFFAIHDSFNCHAANAQIMQDTVKEVFIEMYRDQKVLNQINEWADSRNMPINLAPGRLDLNEILKNEYFIS